MICQFFDCDLSQGVSIKCDDWQKKAEGEFLNIVNNPIWQTISFIPFSASVIRIDAERLNSGSKILYEDLQVLSD